MPTDHSQWLRSLSREQRQQLTKKSNVRGLLHLAVHAGLIVLISWLITKSTVGWPVKSALMLGQGILLVFLFTLLHETTHYTPFKTRRLNDVVAWCCGIILFLPPIWFRYFHLAHHRWTQDPTKDPELSSPKPNTLGQYIVYLSGFPVWKSHIGTIYRNATRVCCDFFVPAHQRQAVLIESRLMLCVYLCIFITALAMGIGQLLTVWLIPLLVGQPFLRAYLLAEHADCPLVGNRFENTRTLLSNPVVRWIAWNMPYHAEHHVYPAVPFFRLPQAHVLTQKYLQQLEPGYRSFHRKFAGKLRQ